LSYSLRNVGFAAMLSTQDVDPTANHQFNADRQIRLHERLFFKIVDYVYKI